jgi:hypothetical protein
MNCGGGRSLSLVAFGGGRESGASGIVGVTGEYEGRSGLPEEVLLLADWSLLGLCEWRLC